MKLPRLTSADSLIARIPPRKLFCLQSLGDIGNPFPVEITNLDGHTLPQPESAANQIQSTPGGSHYKERSSQQVGELKLRVW